MPRSLSERPGLSLLTSLSSLRRAVAERAENIGIWFKILEMLAQLAVISNVRESTIIPCLPQAFLIAFTSDFIQKLVYKFSYGEVHLQRNKKNLTVTQLRKTPLV